MNKYKQQEPVISSKTCDNEYYDEKFEQIYSGKISVHIEELEEIKRKAKKQEIKVNAIYALHLVLGFMLYFSLWSILGKLIKFISKSYELQAICMFWYSIIYIGVNIYIFLKYYDTSEEIRYENEFKLKVIKALIESFDENLEYLPHCGIHPEVYDEAEFEKYDYYSSDDLIKGKLNNDCNFFMSEVLTENRRESSKGGSQYYVVFSGIFTKIKMKKSFKASLYLRKDRKDKNFLSRLINVKLPFDELRIKTDLHEFEKMFDVYSSDENFAKKLITSEVMQLLIDFRKAMNMPYEITIKNNCIYTRINSGRMFEANDINHLHLDKKKVYEYYKMLEFTFSLTNALMDIVNNIEYNQ